MSLTEQKRVSEWMPIASAPKDGREFLAVHKDSPATSYRVVYFDDEAMEPHIWHVEDAGKGFNHHREFFTHWMPLPAPPASHSEGAET